LSGFSRGVPPNLRQSWIPHDSQRRFRTRGERVLVFRHHRRGAHVSRIRPLSFVDQADNPAIGGHSHISNGPCAHVPRPHAPSAPSLAEGNGPFKTHRPNCCEAVQSNPSLAHRRGVQDFSRPTNPSPRRRPKNALHYAESRTMPNRQRRGNTREGADTARCGIVLTLNHPASREGGPMRLDCAFPNTIEHLLSNLGRHPALTVWAERCKQPSTV
jgi:hypothetical protein